MKTLASFIIITLSLAFLAGLSGCQFSTNPKDHGLPTMEELVQSPSFNSCNMWSMYSHEKELPNKVRIALLQEKKFFYTYANPVYLKNKKKFICDTQFAIRLEQKLEKEHSIEWQRFKKRYPHRQRIDSILLVQTYFNVLLDMEKQKAKN